MAQQFKARTLDRVVARQFPPAVRDEQADLVELAADDDARLVGRLVVAVGHLAVDDHLVREDVANRKAVDIVRNLLDVVSAARRNEGALVRGQALAEVEDDFMTKRRLRLKSSAVHGSPLAWMAD